jgi:hypothetical protein
MQIHRESGQTQCGLLPFLVPAVMHFASVLTNRNSFVSLLNPGGLRRFGKTNW